MLKALQYYTQLLVLYSTLSKAVNTGQLLNIKAMANKYYYTTLLCAYKG
jgi:hypothetical protein